MDLFRRRGVGGGGGGVARVQRTVCPAAVKIFCYKFWYVSSSVVY
jgi:hypothetical protein